MDDVALLTAWRAGHLTEDDLTPAVRRRLWQLVLAEALTEAKTKAIRDLTTTKKP